MKKISVIIFLSLIVFASCAKTGAVSKLAQTGALVPPHPRVHFPFDSDEVLTEELVNLDKNAEWMKLNSGSVIILEGHCDEAGETSYNMELGDRRARTVKGYLIEKGVPYDRVIMVVSFGDTRPLDPAHSIEAWRKNRRVEFIIR